MRTVTLLALALTPLGAVAGSDLNGDGCDDAAFAANRACVHPTADVDGNTIGARAYIGPYTSLFGLVRFSPYATIDGATSSGAPAVVVGPTFFGRRVQIGFDADIDGDNTWSPDAVAGDRLFSENNVTIGYNATVGDDVILRSGATLSNLVTLGNFVEIGMGSRLGRESYVASGTLAIPTRVFGSLGADVEIGSGALIEEDARVLRAAHVGAGSVVGTNATVRRDAFVHPGAIVGAFAVVGAGAEILSGAEVPPFTFVPRGTRFGRCDGPAGAPVVISTPTTIAAEDTSFDCLHVRIQSTVTLAGEHTFRSLVVASGGTLTHDVGDVGGVIVRVDETVDVQIGGSIDVSGRGGRGGYNAGLGANGELWTLLGVTSTGGANGRSGGSYGSRGAQGTNTGPPNAVYDDARTPLGFGAGGGSLGSSNPGGNGGGRIDIVTSDLIVNGALKSNGGACFSNCGGGSGGAIRVAVTGTWSGSGTIEAVGGAAQFGPNRGGDGRVAVTGFSTRTYANTPNAATVILVGANTQGVYIAKGTDAHVAIPAGDTPQTVGITSGGAVTSYAPFSLAALDIAGSLTMHAPFTVLNGVTHSSGSSVFHDAVSVGNWIQSSGNATFNDDVTSSSWTQGSGSSTFLAALDVGTWTQTGGTTTIGAGVTFAPTTVSVSNSTFHNGGHATLLSFTPAVVANTTFYNTGVLELVDGSLIDVAPGTTLRQDGVWRTVGGADGAFGALTVGGTLSNTAPTFGGLAVTISGTVHVQSTGDIDATGGGGRGAAQPGNPSTATGQRWTATGPTSSGGSAGRTAGSYGSLGNEGTNSGPPNAVYDDARDPLGYGAGGGGVYTNTPGGNGGGRLDITAGSLIVDGDLLANGLSCGGNCGSGSGGAIRVVTGLLSGAGSIQAVGGNAAISGAKGGGGRVAVRFGSSSYTGPVSAATVALIANNGTQGVFVANGASAAVPIAAGEQVSSVSILGGGAVTSHAPLSFGSFDIGGSLTVYAPFTVTNGVTHSSGSSVFHDSVSVGTWTQSSGSVTFQDDVTSSSWTQGSGSSTFLGAMDLGTWTQTGGTATVGAGVTFAPTTVSLSNSTFNNGGHATLASFTPAIVANSTFYNTGVLELVDGSLIDVAPGTTLRQDGVWRTVGGADSAFGALTVGGTLSNMSPTFGGLAVTTSGTVRVLSAGDLNANGGGGRGAAQPGNPSTATGQRWTATGPTSTGGSAGRTGGSYGSLGNEGTNSGPPNPVYDVALDPQGYGAGGGGVYTNTPGGNGGGRVHIVAANLIVDGAIQANGQTCGGNCGSGSGGAIRAVVSGTVSGAGTLQAIGGVAAISGGAGGGGRIALTGGHSWAFTGTVSAGPGTTYVNGVLLP